MAGQFQADWRHAPLDAKTRTLLDYAHHVTKNPDACREQDIKNLRAAGYSDAEIHDAVQIIGYFNYINRVVGALGCDPEPEWRPSRQ